MPKVKITVGAKIDAGGRYSLGRRLRRVIQARGGNQQRWLIGWLTRICEQEERALGFRRRAPRQPPA